MRIKYFAYGSNLYLPRFRQRVPSAQVLATACLPGFKLQFNKRGLDGSAKANACFTGVDDHVVHGVVYQMNVKHKPTLDQLEAGYEVREVEVWSDNAVIKAFTYTALVHYLLDEARPFHWYKAYISTGAEQHGLIEKYVEMIRAHPAQDDLDSSRTRRHLKLLKNPQG